MAKTLSLSDVKTHLPSLISEIEEREEELVVTRNGKPAAVLVNVDEFARLKATLDVLSDPEMMRQIRASRRFFQTAKRGTSFEDVFGQPLRPPRKRGRRR
jgi:prevent-host-death family protein